MSSNLSYPKKIEDCKKGPSQGGLSIGDLKTFAIAMGLDITGLKKAEICDLIAMKLTKDIKPSPKTTLIKKELIQQQPKPEIEKPIQKRLDCQVKNSCPSGYRRADLVEIAKKCGVEITRSPPGKGNKNMFELCQDIFGVMGKAPEVETKEPVKITKSVQQQKEVKELPKKEISKDAELLRKINNGEDVKGEFNDLLYTHNTNIPTFLKMATGEYKNIRCCQESPWGEGEIPYARGAQFRYGLDSQYGEVKIILKPDFWEQYSRGVAAGGGAFLDHPNFVDFFKAGEYGPDAAKLQYILDTQAKNYNFRNLDIKNNKLKNSGGDECAIYSDMIEKNYKEGKPPSILDLSFPSWCNIQLHLGNNVSFDDVLAVIVPGYLKNDTSLKFPDLNGKEISVPKILTDANTKDKLENGQKNPFKGKIIFGPAVPPEEYYSKIMFWIMSQKIRDNDVLNFYDSIQDKISNKTLPSDKFMARDSFPFGNSSWIAVSPKIFEEETKIYMKKLVEEGMNDLKNAKKKKPKLKTGDQTNKSFEKLIKDSKFPGNITEYLDKANELFDKYEYNSYSIPPTWYFFEKGERQSEPKFNFSNQWKVFYNPKREYFFPVLEIILNTLKDTNTSGNVIGKIVYNPFRSRMPGRPLWIDSPLDPKIVLYYIEDTSEKAQKKLKKQTEMILDNIPKNMLEEISLPCIYVNIDNEKILQCGTSFTKKLNDLIFYTQGGFTETSRNNIVNQAKFSGKKAKTLLAKEYDGENFYKYKGETDPFDL